jgi:hypothetical protein
MRYPLETCMRKTVGRPKDPPKAALTGEIDVSALAHVFVTSEDPGHPIENAFDDQRGPGASEWVAAEPGAQSVTIVFDAPQDIRTIAIEVEEQRSARTQELELAVASRDDDPFQVVVRQEFNFSPPATSFERETWTIDRRGVSRVRISIRPDKQATHDARARLTSLVIR